MRVRGWVTFLKCERQSRSQAPSSESMPLVPCPSLETQRITKKLCVLAVIYTTGDRNFITLTTMLKQLHTTVMEPDPHQCPPTDDKCAPLKHIFQTLFVYAIELATVSYGRTVQLSQKICHRPFRPKKTIRALDVFSIRDWVVGPIELYFQTCSLIIYFQNKHMDNAIYCLRTKV